MLWRWISMMIVMILMFFLGFDFFLVWNGGLLLMYLFLVLFFPFWLGNRHRLFLRRRCLLLRLRMCLLSKITHYLCLLRFLGCFEIDTTLLNLLKMLLENRVRIESYNSCLNFSLWVEHSSEGKGVSLELVTNSGIPSTVEVVYLKLPMFFCL